MSITYTIDRESNIINEVWIGEIQAADLEEYWKRYLADPDVLAIRRTIADLRQAEILFMGRDLGSLIRNIVTPVLAGRDWKTAIVVENPIQFGVGRQYQSLADYYSKDAIFNSVEEARSWLCRSDSVKQ